MARFAILAYAPSLHAKHAVIAALAAHHAREAYGDRWDDLLIECARYTAESRQPWSEPPILDPAPVEGTVPELRDAVMARDRPGAETWLAAHLEDPDNELFAVAAEDFEDLGMKVIVTDAAIQLSHILGERGRYAALRIAVWEMTAAPSGKLPPEASSHTEAADLRSRLVDNALAENGSIESVQAVFLFDAAKGRNIFDRVCGYLATLPLRDAPAVTEKKIEVPIYRLARDYGQHLRAFASGDKRLQIATAFNLENAQSFVDWSLA